MRPSGELSSGHDELVSAVWREIDTILCAIIFLALVWLAAFASGVHANPLDLLRRSSEFLGFTAPVFLVAGAFIVWVSGAIALDLSGFAPVGRRWSGIAGGLYYVENAAPFVGLLECFISIVTALLAYSAAGATVQAQSAMIASIAVALGASAAGCFVALCAHSLRTLVMTRMIGSNRSER